MNSIRPVQGWAQRKRLSFFKDELEQAGKTLEVGAGSGWVKNAITCFNMVEYTGIDIYPPADIIGDINEWQNLGLEPESFDTIIAFEVVEHVDCFDACYQLLRPGGKMLITTPIPSMDWVLKITEALGLNQKRTSPHDHLVDLRTAPFFKTKIIKYVAGLGQWAVFTK